MELANIIVIDDDVSLRTVVRKVLERVGHEVREAADGRAGLDLVREQEPHLVISDLLMPEADGLEVIQAIREGFPELKVLAISGAATQGWRPLECAELLGAHSSLGKPFHAGDLCTAVDRLLAT